MLKNDLSSNTVPDYMKLYRIKLAEVGHSSLSIIVKVMVDVKSDIAGESYATYSTPFQKSTVRNDLQRG